MNERRVAVAGVINYSIFKCLFTDMNSGLGLMVINSQNFPVLFEPQSLWGGEWDLGQLGWVRCSYPSRGIRGQSGRGWWVTQTLPIAAPSYHRHLGDSRPEEMNGSFSKPPVS